MKSSIQWSDIASIFLIGFSACAAIPVHSAPPAAGMPLPSMATPALLQNPVPTPPVIPAANAGAGPNCSMSISNASLEFGRIKAPAARNAAGEFPVSTGQRVTSLQITCSRPASFALVVSGEAHPDDAKLAFGAFGNAAISVRSGRVDGRNARFAQVDMPGQQPRNWQDQLVWKRGKALLVSSGSGVQPASQVQIELAVDAVFEGAKIRPTAASSISSAVTFELVSL